mmetsp:Transcript_10733/g.17510  ORF Transcript_10733/g.17510 Transcript_10733/m.17510 type:complete len:214 (-) Transcript_10733:514-1155(-)
MVTRSRHTAISPRASMISLQTVTLNTTILTLRSYSVLVPTATTARPPRRPLMLPRLPRPWRLLVASSGLSVRLPPVVMTHAAILKSKDPVTRTFCRTVTENRLSMGLSNSPSCFPVLSGGTPSLTARRNNVILFTILFLVLTSRCFHTPMELTTGRAHILQLRLASRTIAAPPPFTSASSRCRDSAPATCQIALCGRTPLRRCNNTGSRVCGG